MKRLRRILRQLFCRHKWVWFDLKLLMGGRDSHLYWSKRCCSKCSKIKFNQMKVCDQEFEIIPRKETNTREQGQ